MNFHTRQYSNLVLNGNEVTGNTFPAREWIKTHLAGKWNGERKSWAIDTEKFNRLLQMGAIFQDAEVTPVATKVAPRVNNGLCPRCHTYCYGDCTAK